VKLIDTSTISNRSISLVASDQLAKHNDVKCDEKRQEKEVIEEKSNRRAREGEERKCVFCFYFLVLIFLFFGIIIINKKCVTFLEKTVVSQVKQLLF